MKALYNLLNELLVCIVERKKIRKTSLSVNKGWKINNSRSRTTRTYSITAHIKIKIETNQKKNEGIFLSVWKLHGISFAEAIQIWAILTRKWRLSLDDERDGAGGAELESSWSKHHRNCTSCRHRPDAVNKKLKQK